ncbi:RING-H2 finger protein ATL58-like [Amborella trichopoda]|uniref:RING-H2 finger protein ATL58-like n=1 Tax=Amborella trichopoda TaxID=13333 RepID=UPI0005D2DB22|nr:RING-H2 finger protein ATL58-like [Amborella trichopoda]|eukprot:XP_011626354.1 RING-H2 finger protein ATL58-like [Amborella trichopoda]
MMNVATYSQRPPEHPATLPDLKLYQALIFSVPILFTIILMLLFYMLYLRRKNFNSQMQPTFSNQPTAVLSSAADLGASKELMGLLPIITFNKSLTVTDTECCVCLGEYQNNEQLHQIPLCRHTFHKDCIHHWLVDNSTCPLCRGPLLPSNKAQQTVEVSCVLNPNGGNVSINPTNGTQNLVDNRIVIRIVEHDM